MIRLEKLQTEPVFSPIFTTWWDPPPQFRCVFPWISLKSEQKKFIQFKRNPLELDNFGDCGTRSVLCRAVPGHFSPGGESKVKSINPNLDKHKQVQVHFRRSGALERSAPPTRRPGLVTGEANSSQRASEWAAGRFQLVNKRSSSSSRLFSLLMEAEAV